MISLNTITSYKGTGSVLLDANGRVWNPPDSSSN